MNKHNQVRQSNTANGNVLPVYTVLDSTGRYIRRAPIAMPYREDIAWRRAFDWVVGEKVPK